MTITKKQIEETFTKVHPHHLEMAIINERVYLLSEKLAKKENLSVIEIDNIKKEIKELKAELVYKPLQFLIYGESGLGKTYNTIAAYTKLGIPIVMLQSAAESDAAVYTGIPYRDKTNSSRMKTIKALPDYLPEMVLDDDGEIKTHKDGNIVWNYDALGDKILNREAMLEFYDGDINKAPYMVLLLDDVNKTPSEEVKLVHFVLQNIYDNYTLEGAKTPQMQIVLTGNPESPLYNTNGMFDDTAVISRLVCLELEASEESALEDLKTMNFDFETKFVLTSMPELMVPKVDNDWKPAFSRSLRSASIFNSLLKVFRKESTLLQAMLEGVFGSSTSIDIMATLDKGIDVPTASEILTDFDSKIELITKYIGSEDAEETQQGIVYTMNESLLSYLNNNKEELIKKGFLYDEIKEKQIEEEAKAIGVVADLATNQLKNLGKYLGLLPLPQRFAFLNSVVALESVNNEDGSEYHVKREFYKNQEIVTFLKNDLKAMQLERTSNK